MKKKRACLPVICLLLSLLFAMPVYAGTSYVGPNASGHVYVHYHDSACTHTSACGNVFSLNAYYAFTGQGITGYQYVGACTRCGRGFRIDAAVNSGSTYNWYTCPGTITTYTCGLGNGSTWVASPHDWGETTVLEEATCTTNGSGDHTCKTCGWEATYTIPALGHDYHRVDDPLKPTLSKDGVARWVCSRGDATYEDYIPKRKLTYVFGGEKQVKTIEAPRLKGKGIYDIRFQEKSLTQSCGDATPPTSTTEQRLILP